MKNSIETVVHRVDYSVYPVQCLAEMMPYPWLQRRRPYWLSTRIEYGELLAG